MVSPSNMLIHALFLEMFPWIELSSIRSFVLVFFWRDPTCTCILVFISIILSLNPFSFCISCSLHLLLSYLFCSLLCFQWYLLLCSNLAFTSEKCFYFFHDFCHTLIHISLYSSSPRCPVLRCECSSWVEAFKRQYTTFLLSLPMLPWPRKWAVVDLTVSHGGGSLGCDCQVEGIPTNFHQTLHDREQKLY